MNNYRPVISTLILALMAVLCGGLRVSAQDVIPLEPGKPITRTTTRAENHTYQLNLTAGQFIRIVAEEIEMDVGLKLVTADNKLVLESDFNHQIFGQESLAWMVTATGEYRLLIRPFYIVTDEHLFGSNVAPYAMLSGAYRVQLEVKATSTAQDKTRIAAEGLLREAQPRPSLPALEQSITKYRQAIQLWRELKDKHWEAITFCLIGRVYIYYMTGKKMRPIPPFTPPSASALEREAGIYYPQAIEAFKQALLLQQELQDQANQVSTLNQLGLVYQLWGHTDQALASHEQALNISRASKNYPAERLALNNLQTHYANSRNRVKGIEYLEQVLVLDRAHKNLMNEGHTLYRIGLELIYLANYEKALKYQDDALQLIRSRGNWAEEQVVLLQVTVLNRLMSRYEKAIEHIEHSRRLQKRYRELEVWELLFLGDVYGLLNRNEKSIEYLEEALERFRQSKSRSGESVTFLKLSEAYIAMGHYD